MSPDEQLRRQLRFAFFLQVAAGAMFGIAFIVRASAIGFDAVTGIFGLIAVAVGGAAIFTRRKMQELRS